MQRIHFVLAGALAVLTACSSSPVAEDNTFDSKKTAEIVPIPVEVDVDLTRVYIKKPSSTGKEIPPESAAVPGNPTAISAAPSLVSASSPAPVETNVPPVTQASSEKSPKKKRNGGVITYRVKQNDTLMKISFAVLGDLKRWRELAEQNPGKIGKFNTLTKGTVLKIRVTDAVEVDRNGDPYLIRRRDTLIKISDHLYGTPRKWWALWDNNRQLIHDPNRIYAGFTLYYQPDPGKRSFTQADTTVKSALEEAVAETASEKQPAVDSPVPNVVRAPAAHAEPESKSSLPASEIPETAPSSVNEAPSASGAVSGA